MKEIYWWKNAGITMSNSSQFVEAQEIVLSALLSGKYDIVRKEKEAENERKEMR